MQYKFRGQQVGTGKWVYGSLLVCEDSLGPIYYIMVQHKFPFEREQFLVRMETVGQWTGLKDKNGTKIYEGDILKGWMGEQGRIDRSPIISTVVLKEGGFEVFAKPMTRCTVGQFLWCDHGTHGREDIYYIIGDIEITGSIHDSVNPASGQSGVNHMQDPNLAAASQQEPANQEAITEHVAEGQEQVNAAESAAQDAAVEATETVTTAESIEETGG